MNNLVIMMVCKFCSKQLEQKEIYKHYCNEHFETLHSLVSDQYGDV